MKADVFFEVLEHVDEKLVEEARTPQRHRKKRKFFTLAALAACFAFVIGGSFFFLRGDGSHGSSNVTIQYTDPPVFSASKDELIYLTEEEIFTHFELAIFKGIITDIQNIQLDFSGIKEYRALAQIQIEAVYHGNCEAGETVTVLLHCPISTDVWVGDTDIISALEVGIRGIFMPTAYSEHSYWEQNGATLFMKDLVDYGFADGQRYAFLETKHGLLYAKEAFPSMTKATTLDAVEQYIIQMIAMLL